MSFSRDTIFERSIAKNIKVECTVINFANVLCEWLPRQLIKVRVAEAKVRDHIHIIVFSQCFVSMSVTGKWALSPAT